MSIHIRAAIVKDDSASYSLAWQKISKNILDMTFFYI
jgi:hypothetical protein